MFRHLDLLFRGPCTFNTPSDSRLSLRLRMLKHGCSVNKRPSCTGRPEPYLSPEELREFQAAVPTRHEQRQSEVALEAQLMPVVGAAGPEVKSISP